MLNWKMYSPQQSQARAVHIQMPKYNPIIFKHDSNSILDTPQTQHVWTESATTTNQVPRETGLTDLKLTSNLAGSFTVMEQKGKSVFVGICTELLEFLKREN